MCRGSSLWGGDRKGHPQAGSALLQSGRPGMGRWKELVGSRGGGAAEYLKFAGTQCGQGRKKQSCQWAGALQTAYPLPLSAEGGLHSRGTRRSRLSPADLGMVALVRPRLLLRQSISCHIHTFLHAIVCVCLTALPKWHLRVAFTLPAAHGRTPAVHINRGWLCPLVR